ncbi:hypothetical protein Tco_0219076 [Tanacetum coccineum]
MERYQILEVEFRKPRGGRETRVVEMIRRGPIGQYNHGLSIGIIGDIVVGESSCVSSIYRNDKTKLYVESATTYGFVKSEKRLEAYSLKEWKHIVFRNERWSKYSSFMEEALFKSAVNNNDSINER